MVLGETEEITLQVEEVAVFLIHIVMLLVDVVPVLGKVEFQSKACGTLLVSETLLLLMVGRRESLDKATRRFLSTILRKCRQSDHLHLVKSYSSSEGWSNFNAERVSDYKDDSPHELETKHHQHMIWDHLPGPQNVAKCHSASFLENS